MIARLLSASVILGALSSGALAADLPNTKGPPAFPPPPVFTWTGVYIGGQAGYQWGANNPSFDLAPGDIFVGYPPGSVSQGVVGGGHIGYNYQLSPFEIGQVVIGIEGDVEGTSYAGTGLDPTSTFFHTTNIAIEGSVRGRIGWAWDRVLIYGTGGVALASIRNTAGIAAGPTLFSQTDGRVGWTVGGGVEYALDQNWTIRGEYRYTNYGDYDFPLVAGTALREQAIDNRAEMGFSYKFDFFEPPAPVVAKY